MHDPTTPTASEFNLKILGHNIKEGRKRMGNIPQKELADLVGISAHTLIDIESGKRDLSVSKAIEIAKHLQIPPTHLLGLGDGAVVHNLNNNQQDGKVNILNSGTMSSEREMYEMRIEELQKQITAAEKTCADLREDKTDLRAQLTILRTQLASLTP